MLCVCRVQAFAHPVKVMTEHLERNVWYLGFLHRGIVFVTHGTDLHAPLPLAVTLAEELLHDTVCPLAVQLQWFGGVTQVCTVHHVL